MSDGLEKSPTMLCTILSCDPNASPLHLHTMKICIISWYW
jgi:hypothetical protein